MIGYVVAKRIEIFMRLDVEIRFSDAEVKIRNYFYAKLDLSSLM